MSYIEDIRIYDRKEDKFRSVLTNCVSHMFKRILKSKLRTPNVFIFSIYLTDDESKHLSYYHYGGFLTIDYFFDPDVYQESKDVFERKKMILDMIRNALLHVASCENWGTDIILDTYNTCLASEIKNEWWFKGKPIASPDRRHYIGMYTVYDFSRFEYWLVLFDKAKTELIRHLVYKDRAEIFVISHLSWQDREHIVYKFGGPQKLFIYSIDDLLQSRVAEIPEKIHLMFK
jgi:hypothetical protein